MNLLRMPHCHPKERVRQRVNAWMRGNGEFDALLDFDAVTRDPAHPARFLLA